ncbi:MAG: alpha-L-fucosidase [Terriglobia bacterium]
MSKAHLSRRDYLKLFGGSAALAATGAKLSANAEPIGIAGQEQRPAPPEESSEVQADRARRMKWWHEAKFGMFIHWGLYSTLGRHEWAMEMEGIPVVEYEQLAKHFKPVPHAARAWARLAKNAGQKYMVMTTKHHEGFCNFDTKLTNYCAPKQGPGRDLVREYVDAARAEGLRVGFYYSLMDWHHPDGARCATDEAARQRFVAYTHGLIRELMTNYGTIDVLWYDVAWPLDAKGWESEKMNKMVFELQPNIIVNNRNKLPGDFSTPEQHIQAEKGGRAWESCMTMNDSWGYQKADDDWKNPKTVVRNLVTCAEGGGNYLFNIGPKGDGTIPEESVRILTRAGQWLQKHGETIYQSEPCQVSRSVFAKFTRIGNTLYAHVYFWPGSTFGIGGLKSKVLSAKILTTGQKAEFTQDDFRVKFTGLPVRAPDDVATVLALECESEPVQDMLNIRENRPRDKV